MTTADDVTEVLEGFHSENFVFEYLYPYPLADLFRRYRVSRSPVDQLGYLLAAGEASLKFLSALAFSLQQPSSNLTSQLGELKVRAPSFGKWQQLLETIVSHQAESSPAPGLHSALFHCVRDREGKQGLYLRSTRVLVERRNEYAHAGTMTSDTATAVLSSVLPSFRQAFRQLAFLARCPMVICEEVRRIRRPPCFEAVVRICQGCNPVFPYELWRLDEPLDPQVPLLLAPDLSAAYSLHPLVVVFPDERSRLPRFYFFSRCKSSTYWQTYDTFTDNLRRGTPELEEEMSGFLSGESRQSPYTLQYHSNSRPTWPVPLPKNSESISLPTGYKMLGCIGQGRYGTVFRVLHVGLQETRALKVLQDAVVQDPRMRKRFEVEALALSRLRGKDVAVDLYEYSETSEGLPYLLMQFAEQGSLEEAIQRWGSSAWREVLDIAILCYRNLEIVHDNGILHRDIKPSNILLERNRYLFCDFGVAQFLDIDQHLTLEGDAIGTLAYIAPEQKTGVSDARSDLFSLGVCLVSLLAGMNVGEPRRWLYESYDGDKEFRNALLGVLEPLPENRPPSSAAIAERLEGIRKHLVAMPETDTNTTIMDQAETAAVAGISLGTLEPTPRQSFAPARIWRSPDGTVYREIPSGEFLMGGTKYPDERPVHKVSFVEPFYMATTLVTNAQYREFCGSTRYRGDHINFLLHLRQRPFSAQWRHPDAPVVFISWRDAKEYILWRCERDDRDYRLPTEAQWEYACRAGTRTVYPWGNLYDETKLNTKERHGYPTPVGTYPPNPWGLFDMIGNVWEWCEDVFDVLPMEESLFYRYCADLAPETCKNPVNTGPSALLSRRVAPNLRAGRGGSWFSESHNCRPANRRGEEETACLRSFGFRLVADNVPQKEIVDSTL